MKNKLKIAVIGGGAAGFFSALSAAEHDRDAEVTIFEATNKLLAKVLISGGGRCNVTNHTLHISELIKNYPRGSNELRGPFSRFAVPDTIAWFAERGVQLKTEPDKRMFPVTNSSETIALCLMERAKELGVTVQTRQKVSKVKLCRDKQFQLFLNGQDIPEETLFDKIIFTTGGSRSSWEVIQSLGHTITTLAPSLFSFEIQDPRLVDLAGVSFPDVKLELRCASGNTFRQQGPVLITHWGLSGPAVIKLSALAARDLFESDYQATLKINFLPSTHWDAVLQRLLKQKEESPRLTAHADSFLSIPKRYWSNIIGQIVVNEKKTWSEFSKKQLHALATELTQASYQVSGKGKFKDEFVTSGGVSLTEVNCTTMESRIIPGVFFAGEVLDIDGITGGFNFQSAWTTGWVAGKSSCSQGLANGLTESLHETLVISEP